MTAKKTPATKKTAAKKTPAKAPVAAAKPADAPTKVTMTPEAFCVAWESAPTLSDFVAQTGMLKVSACRRAVNYRKAGINLKAFKPGRRLNVEALNALVEGVRS